LPFEAKRPSLVGCRGCFKAFTTGENGQRQEIFKYENKGSFGELALMYYTQRQATVVSATTGTLWTLDRDTFRRLVLNRAHEKRLIYDRFLRTVPMLQTLTVLLKTPPPDRRVVY
jgi:CRP-like cAMP-binding protein